MPSRLKSSLKSGAGTRRKHRPHWNARISGSEGLHPAPSDVLSGLQLEDAVLFNAVKKVINPPDKLLALGCLAGLWVGLGGLAAVSAAGGVPDEVRHEWVSLPKFLMGAFFAFALHMIVMFGGDLFTGNTMALAIGYYNRVVSLRSIFVNLTIVYIGNWAGCLFVAYFFGYLTKLFDHEQHRNYLDEVVRAKLEDLNWGQIFLRAIPANTMVCMAYMLGIACRGAAGKMFALWFPVVMFVLCGFEHCVANMFFTSLGLMYGASSTIGRLWYNQSAAVCGNLVGGAIFIGLTAHMMNHWVSPIFISDYEGTLLGHDVESTRRARDADSGHSSISDEKTHSSNYLPQVNGEDVRQHSSSTEGLAQRSGDSRKPPNHVEHDSGMPANSSTATTDDNLLQGDESKPSGPLSENRPSIFSKVWKTKGGKEDPDPAKMV